MFSLEERGKCWFENRLLVQNLTAIFSYDVNRALNTMSMYNLREYYLLLEEKDRKFRSSPNLHCALLFPWLELQVCQRAVPCWGVPLQLCQLLVAFGAIEAERRAVTIHLQTPVLLSSAPREVNPKYPDFLNLCFSALMRCQLCLF